ncbi:hypothetical protein AC1031_008576 [Aphanomyces cochlioides]|nr:hypothetical protein AC1031_008576 [Aphanomyces cochlioides]
MATWAVALAGSTGATDVWDAHPHEFMAQSESAAAKFDFYVFAYSWQAEFCNGKSYPGCANPEPYWETHFTIHGLWPDVEKGSHPGFCTSEAFNSNYVRTTIGESVLEQYWPNVKILGPRVETPWHVQWPRPNHLLQSCHSEDLRA